MRALSREAVGPGQGLSTPRCQMDEEGALPLPTVAQRLFLTRPTGPGKPLPSPAHLIPEKFIAARLKQGTEFIFDSQIERKLSNLFMISVIFLRPG